MATDMERACDDDELVPRCDGCGGVLEDEVSPVIYYCFHALHAGCAHGRDACPRCNTPRLVYDDDDDDQPPEQVEDEAAAASPPGNNLDEDSALASDGMVPGIGNDNRHGGGGETGEPRANRCDGDGERPASLSGPGCNCACSRRVTELEDRLEEKSAALIETTNVLESKLGRVQGRLCILEEMYGKLEGEVIRLRDGKRAREIDDAEEEPKKPRNGGRSVSSSPQDQTD